MMLVILSVTPFSIFTSSNNSFLNSFNETLQKSNIYDFYVDPYHGGSNPIDDKYLNIQKLQELDERNHLANIDKSDPTKSTYLCLGYDNKEKKWNTWGGPACIQYVVMTDYETNSGQSQTKVNEIYENNFISLSIADNLNSDVYNIYSPQTNTDPNSLYQDFSLSFNKQAEIIGTLPVYNSDYLQHPTIGISPKFAEYNDLKIGSNYKINNHDYTISAITYNAVNIMPRISGSHPFPNFKTDANVYMPPEEICKWASTGPVFNICSQLNIINKSLIGSYSTSEPIISSNYTYYKYADSTNVDQKNKILNNIVNSLYIEGHNNSTWFYDYKDIISGYSAGTGVAFQQLNQSRILYLFLIIILTVISSLIAMLLLKKIVNINGRNIGVLKSSGFSNKEIIISFIPYFLVPILLGSVIGYSVGFFAQAFVTTPQYYFYEMPVHVFYFDWVTFLMAIFVPLIVLGTSCIIVLFFNTRQSSLFLLNDSNKNKTSKLASKTSVLLLKANMPFYIRIRSSFVMKNPSRVFFMFFNICLSTFLMTFAIAGGSSFSNLLNSNYGDIKYNYSYRLNTEDFYELNNWSGTPPSPDNIFKYQYTNQQDIDKNLIPIDSNKKPSFDQNSYQTVLNKISSLYYSGDLGKGYYSTCDQIPNNTPLLEKYAGECWFQPLYESGVINLTPDQKAIISLFVNNFPKNQNDSSKLLSNGEISIGRFLMSPTDKVGTSFDIHSPDSSSVSASSALIGLNNNLINCSNGPCTDVIDNKGNSISKQIINDNSLPDSGQIRFVVSQKPNNPTILSYTDKPMNIYVPSSFNLIYGQNFQLNQIIPIEMDTGSYKIDFNVQIKGFTSSLTEKISYASMNDINALIQAFYNVIDGQTKQIPPKYNTPLVGKELLPKDYNNSDLVVLPNFLITNDKDNYINKYLTVPFDAGIAKNLPKVNPDYGAPFQVGLYMNSGFLPAIFDYNAAKDLFYRLNFFESLITKFIAVLASFLSFAIIFTLVFLTINDNKKIIAIMATLGYKKRKTNSIFIGIYTPVVVAGIATTIPLSYILLEHLSKMLQSKNIILPINVDIFQVLLIIFSVIFIFYFVYLILWFNNKAKSNLEIINTQG